MGEHDTAPCTVVHDPPSISYWKTMPLPAVASLMRISRSSTAPSRASKLPFGSVTVSDGRLTRGVVAVTTAEAVLVGKLLCPN